MDINDVCIDVKLGDKRIKCDDDIYKLIEEVRFNVGYKITLRNGKEYRIDKSYKYITLSEEVILSLLCYKYLYSKDKLRFVKYVQETSGKLNELGMWIVKCNLVQLSSTLKDYLDLTQVLIPDLIITQRQGDKVVKFVEI